MATDEMVCARAIHDEAIFHLRVSGHGALQEEDAQVKPSFVPVAAYVACFGLFVIFVHFWETGGGTGITRRH